MSTRRVSVIALAAAVVLSLIWYVGLWRTESHKLASANAQYTATEQNIASLQSQISSLQALVRQAPSDKAKLAQLDAALPKTVDLQAVLDEVHDDATGSGVELTSFSPGTATSASASSSAASGVQSLPLSLVATGTYSQLRQFLVDLTTMPRALVVESVSLSGTEPKLQTNLSTRFFYNP